MAGLIPFNKNKSIANTSLTDFYNVIDDFFNDVTPSRFLAQDTFKIDVQDKEKEYLVEAELPGFNKEDILLELNDNKLSISVEKEEKKEEANKNYIHRERKYGSMQRSIYLADVNGEGISAKFENGLLKILIPKIDCKEKAKKIDIK